MVKREDIYNFQLKLASQDWAQLAVFADLEAEEIAVADSEGDKCALARRIAKECRRMSAFTRSRWASGVR